MPPKKRTVRKKKQYGGMMIRTAVYRPTFSTQYGNGFWNSIWNGVKSGTKFVTGNGLISKGLGVAGMLGVPGASIASNVAGQVGLGKRKRKRKLLH